MAPRNFQRIILRERRRLCARNSPRPCPTSAPAWPSSRSRFSIRDHSRRIADLERLLEAPDVWGDPVRARALIAEQKSLRKVVDPVTTLLTDLRDRSELVDLADPDQDAGLLAEISADLEPLLDRLRAVEVVALFRGPEDRKDAVLTIQAGAGGTDAMDWAERLERMYWRWLESEGFTLETVDRLTGAAAGIHHCEIQVSGLHAYGKLRGERGVHRICHISDFDSNGKKQTSFAAVDVVPVRPEVLVDLQEKDLEFETFCSGGPGGQNVNKVASAVRVRHLPSGLMTKCQSHRSQNENKKHALEILASKLRQAELDKRERRPKLEASFGHQMRTYVLEPYQLVKDHRTGFETSNASKVLDGGLGGFSEAFLRLQ